MWWSCRGRLGSPSQISHYEDLTEFYWKHSGSLQLQRPHLPACKDRGTRSVAHFQASGGVLEVFSHRWELIAISEVLMSQRIHLTVRGVFMGYFAEAQTRSGMHVPQAWIWRTKQTIGFWTNPWLCHQSVVQPRATHLLTLLVLSFGEVKIMILCLPILF